MKRITMNEVSEYVTLDYIQNNTDTEVTLKDPWVKTVQGYIIGKGKVYIPKYEVVKLINSFVDDDTDDDTIV